jgi:hypothetical protein
MVRSPSALPRPAPADVLRAGFCAPALRGAVRETRLLPREDLDVFFPLATTFVAGRALDFLRAIFFAIVRVYSD